MSNQTPKKLLVFIIAIMMFSAMPALVNAQKKCINGNCGKGWICVNGYCVKSGGGFCNCLVRPIPAQCAPACGFKIPLPTIYHSSSQLAAISFCLHQPEKISVRVFYINGRLVKTLTDKLFNQGEHKLQWDAAGVNAGVYIVQFTNGRYSETKKIAEID